MASKKINIRFGILLTYISLGVSLLGTMFITNRVLELIGDYNYGLYSFVNSITVWLTVVSSALLSSYLRFTSIEAYENNGDISRTNTIYIKLLFFLGTGILLFGTGTIGILFFCRINFGSYSWADSELIYLLFIFSIIHISITLPATVFSQFIDYNKKFIFSRSLSVLTTILQFVAHFLIAYFTRNIVIISVYSIVSTIFVFTCNYLYSKKNLKISFKKTSFSDNKNLVKSIFAFSSILVINAVVDQININLDKTLLGFYSGPRDVTIYQMGMYFSIYLGSVSVAVSQVFAPETHELCAKRDFEGVNNLFIKVSKIQAMIVVFVTCGFIACGRDFIIWWIGESRITSFYCGAILMVLDIMPLSVKLSIEVQRALNKHKFRGFLYIIVSLLNILISIILLNTLDSKYAIYACLIGTATSSIICYWIAMNIYNKKVIKLPIEKHLLQLGKYILYGIAGICVTFLLSSFVFFNIPSSLVRFLLEGTVFVLVYLVFLMISDRNFIFGFIRGKH